MPRPRFVQIHSLASYPATLLNRDDAGAAKRLPFGGTERSRISSQALKRRWRFAGEAGHEEARRVPHSLQNLDVPMGDRSKELVERAVMPLAQGDLPALHTAARQAVETALIVALYGDKAADAQKRQALFFGQPETDHVLQTARALWGQAASRPELFASATEPPDKKALKEWEDTLKEQLKPLQKNLRALAETTRGAAGLESALFGRMVTSDLAANLHAPVHVAHAFTVHKMERELDYATAVDDLRARGEGEEAAAGSAGIFDVELTSGLYYGYVTIDVELLVSNLNGDAALAGRVVERLVKLIAVTSPGAKKGSTAPHSRAEWLLVEAGDEQPRTLANAFRNPVELNRGDVFGLAVGALQDHLARLDKVYGRHTDRRQLSVTDPALDGVPECSLEEIGAAIRNRLEAA